MATAKTFVQLVNDAIRESGADLDAVTSFTALTSLQDTIKNYVAQAYKDVQLDRRAWEHKQKVANLIISPRVYVEAEAGSTYTPVANDVFTGDDSAASLTVLSVAQLISGTWAAGTAKAYINYSSLDGQWKFNELFDRTSPGATSNVFRVRGYGRYDLDNDVSGLFIPDLNSFTVQSTGGATAQANTADFDSTPVVYIPREHWPYDTYATVTYGKPAYFTRTNEGHYDFWPRPDQQYVLRFYYESSIHELSATTDTQTEIPPDFQDVIVWRAVMYYADYDRKQELWRSARNRYNFYKLKMEEYLLPEVTFGRSEFSC